jgi:hypothetical protein
VRVPQERPEQVPVAERSQLVVVEVSEGLVVVLVEETEQSTVVLPAP